MIFSTLKKLKLGEIEKLDREINEKINDQSRTLNTDSISSLFDQRERRMQELAQIQAAEKARYSQMNRRDGQVLNFFLDRHAENVHENQEHVI